MFNAGKNLKDAVNLNNNDKLKVRLNEALNSLDSHATDVLYHKKCYFIIKSVGPSMYLIYRDKNA